MRETTGEQIRILHVDDDAAFAEMVTEFLQREDDRFVIESIQSVSDGLRKLRDGEFDCLVSDYDMPGKDGIAFLENVRAEFPDIPFILYTGKGNEEVASEAISAGVTDYMQKDTGTDQYTVLANRIKNSVQQYRTEREAERTQKRLQELTESTTDCMWMFSSDWEDLLFISGYEEVWDRSTERIREDPEDFLNAVHPDDREHVQGMMKQISEGDSIDFEYRILRGDDSVGWVWVKGEPIVDESGDVVRVVGFTRDITDRKKHEQELERTTERMELALRGTNAGIWELDLETESVTGHPSPCPIFDREFDTIDGFFEKVHPEDRDLVEQNIQSVIESGEASTLEYRTAADIETTWVEAQTEPVMDSDGSVQLLTGLIRDISARKERERRLNSLYEATTEFIQADTQQEVAELAVETVRDILDLPINGIWFFNPVDTVLEPVAVTEEATDLLGEQPVYEPGESLSWEVFQTQEPMVFENVAEDERRLNPETSIRSEIILPLGDHGVLNIGSTTPQDFDETDVSLVRIMSTIAVSALTRAKNHEELVDQHERLDEFASVVSHDLKGPLSVAKGRLELAQVECESEHLADIATAHDRMETLIEDLLALAQNGKSATEVERVSLETVAKTAWGSVQTATAADLEVESTVNFEADRGRLLQIFENLFRNAIRHGGPDVCVRVGSLDDGFYVTDDGPGIQEEEREKIFERGYSTSGDGAGLGLAIVQRIAEAHGWNVDITESPDGGARFDFVGIQGAK